MKLGLSSYTYGWAVGVRGHEPASPMNEHGLLDQVLSHGLTLLQIGDNLPLDAFEDSRLNALAERIAREQVQLEVGARRLTVERVARYAALARKLDAKLLRFVIDDADYHPSLETIVSLVREALPSLDGLLLGLENHDRFKASELRHLIDAVAADNVGVCLDTANSLGAGEGLETVVAALAPVTLNLHIKDFTVKRVPHMMGFTVEGAAAGSGLLDIRALLAKLRAHDRCRSAILELWTPPESSLDLTIRKEMNWAHISLRYLKPLFA